MPALPTPATDELKLADWLEISALVAKDGSASRGDLEVLLRRSGVLESLGRNAVEDKLLEVFHELDARALAAKSGYPFEVQGGVLRARSKADDFPVYVFCLCLSFFRWKQSTGLKVFPRRMFESLACGAAKVYLGGDCLLFASPREVLPKAFKQALTEVCGHIREGGSYREQATPTPKDDSVDVIAWKPFDDGRPGKLLLFGQCASGADLKGKRSDLNANAFCQQWMAVPPVSPLIQAFFIPYSLALRNWDAISRRAGIVFDRCRLANLLHSQQATADTQRFIKWSKSMLKTA